MLPTVGDPVQRRARPRAVRPGLGLVRRPREHPLRQPGHLRWPLQVLPLLRSRRLEHHRGTAIEGPKLYEADADFDDQEHEFYDLHNDPGELVNLAMDPAGAPRYASGTSVCWPPKLSSSIPATCRADRQLDVIGPAVSHLDRRAHVEVVNEALGGWVASFKPTRIGADRGMLGEIFLLDLRYCDGADGPAQVVAKFAALREESLQSALRGRPTNASCAATTNCSLDADLEPKVLRSVVRPRDCALPPHPRCDRDRPHRRPDQGLELAPGQSSSCRGGSLHARWWSDPQLSSLDWLPRLDADQRRTNMTTIAGLGWQPLLDTFGDALPPTTDRRSMPTCPTASMTLLCNACEAAVDPDPHRPAGRQSVVRT